MCIRDSVHKDRARADVDDDRRRGEKTERGGQDIVPGPHPEGTEGQFQGRGPRRYANAVRGPRRMGEFLFEVTDVVPQHEIVFPIHLPKHLDRRGFQGAMDRGQVCLLYTSRCV